MQNIHDRTWKCVPNSNYAIKMFSLSFLPEPESFVTCARKYRRNKSKTHRCFIKYSSQKLQID